MFDQLGKYSKLKKRESLFEYFTLLAGTRMRSLCDTYM